MNLHPILHWAWTFLSSLSKVILVLGKARSCRVPNLGCKGPESPGWFDVLPKPLHKTWCMSRHSCCDEAANHHLPIAVAFWIIQIVSMEECSSLMQSLLQTCCSTHSVILNVIATQYTCSLNSIYCPHWLVQWSCHCSCMCVPVLSPWLPGYADVAQTILINTGWTFSGQTSYICTTYSLSISLSMDTLVHDNNYFNARLWRSHSN